jgi:hypothetical protein
VQPESYSLHRDGRSSHRCATSSPALTISACNDASRQRATASTRLAHRSCRSAQHRCARPSSLREAVSLAVP